MNPQEDTQTASIGWSSPLCLQSRSAIRMGLVYSPQEWIPIVRSRRALVKDETLAHDLLLDVVSSTMVRHATQHSGQVFGSWVAGMFSGMPYGDLDIMFSCMDHILAWKKGVRNALRAIGATDTALLDVKVSPFTDSYGFAVHKHKLRVQLDQQLVMLMIDVSFHRYTDLQNVRGPATIGSFLNLSGMDCTLGIGTQHLSFTGAVDSTYDVAEIREWLQKGVDRIVYPAMRHWSTMNDEQKQARNTYIQKRVQALRERGWHISNDFYEGITLEDYNNRYSHVFQIDHESLG